MCTVLLPPGVNPIAVDKYNISYPFPAYTSPAIVNLKETLFKFSFYMCLYLPDDGCSQKPKHVARMKGSCDFRSVILHWGYYTLDNSIYIYYLYIYIYIYIYMCVCVCVCVKVTNLTHKLLDVKLLYSFTIFEHFQNLKCKHPLRDC